MTFPPYLFRAQPGGYLCEFDHEDFDRACESVLWHGAWEEQTAQVLAVLARLNVLKDGDDVLDYGCGVGRVAKAVRGKYGVMITAAERSVQMRKHAERYLAGCSGIALCSDETALRGTGKFHAVLAVAACRTQLLYVRCWTPAAACCITRWCRARRQSWNPIGTCCSVWVFDGLLVNWHTPIPCPPFMFSRPITRF